MFEVPVIFLNLSCDNSLLWALLYFYCIYIHIFFHLQHRTFLYHSCLWAHLILLDYKIFGNLVLSFLYVLHHIAQNLIYTTYIVKNMLVGYKFLKISISDIKTVFFQEDFLIVQVAYNISLVLNSVVLNLCSSCFSS